MAPGRRGCWRGRHGTWRHPSLFHVAGVVLAHNLSSHHLLTHNLSSHNLSTYSGVAGVALMALGWLWWRAWFEVWRRDAAAVGVAGVALGDIHLRLTWQAWCSRTTCHHTTCSHTTCRHTTYSGVAGVF